MPVPTTFKKNFYDILGLTKTATDEEIKAAYKSLALQWHPDRHSTQKEEAGRRFIEINEAYKFLTDKGRREWYDNFPVTGDKERGRASATNKDKDKSSAGGGLKVPSAASHRAKSESDMRNFATTGDKDRGRTSGANGSNNDKPFACGGLKVPSAGPHRAKSEAGMRNSAPEPPPPPQDKKSRARAKSTGDRDVQPEADLRDFIHRMSKQDKGTNSKEASLKSHKATVYDASDSDGQPSVQSTGMQLHTTTVVTTGVPSEWIFPLPLTLEELAEGTAHRYRITRHLLSGKKKNVLVDIDIAPGWKKGTKVRFAGAGNERPGVGGPQDVVFIVEELAHDRFMRQGSALVARVQIPLSEALAGEGRSIFLKGLNGKEIEVRVPSSVIKPGSECRIEGAGMPIRKQGKIIGKGDMVIRWEISFPDKLSKKQAKELRKALTD